MDRESIIISMILLFIVLTVTLFSFGTFTGVMADTSTGNVSVFITEVTDINFTTNNVSFGAGSVTGGATSAILVSTSSSTAINGSWTCPGTQLVLENIGSEDVILDLLSDTNAATLIGGTSPSFQWNASEGEGSSCTGAINVTNLFATNWADVNTTAAAGTRLCSIFDATAASDLLYIQFKLVIPVDTTVGGSRSAIMTATGTDAG